MKLLTKTGEELANVALSMPEKGQLSAHVEAGDISLDSPAIHIGMERADEDLGVQMRIPGLMNCRLILERSDIKTLMGLMSKDVIGFFISAFMKKK